MIEEFTVNNVVKNEVIRSRSTINILQKPANM